MKHLFLFCLALSATTLFAQNTTTWFPPGAKWQYHYESLSGPGLEVFDRVGTETFQGHLCAKLHWYGYHFGWPAGPTEYGYRYLYAENDSVFYWTGSEFKLLYDFTLPAGATFQLTNFYFTSGRVDSTGLTQLWDIPVRFQALTLFSASNSDSLKTRIYERFGGQHLLYWNEMSPLSEIEYMPTCYRDDEYPYPACPFQYDLNYQPFPMGTATWSEESSGFCSLSGYQYQLSGDTTIAGIGTGKKVYVRHTYVGNFGCGVPPNMNLQEPFQLVGLLSQDLLAKKVYFTRLTQNNVFPACINTLPADPFPFQQTVPLYDFDLTVGDTVAWRSEPNVVLSIDSVQLKDGSFRRAFHFDDQQYYFWIEGIGSSLGLFNSYANLQAADIGCSLHCYRENGQLKYPKALANDVFCDNIVASAEPPGAGLAIQLYPNPTTGEVTLETPADALPALVRVFDAQGRELGRREITEPVSHWSLRDLGASRLLVLRWQTFDRRSAQRVLRVE